MAAIERRGQDWLASASKRLSGQRFAARRIRAISISISISMSMSMSMSMSIAALIGVAACILVAGCSGHDDRATPAAAAETAPMLPGTRGARALDAEAPAGAQRFETASPPPEPEREAQGPLLQPVMHSAD